MFQKGVAGTSIPEVQEAAHASASQIYHYFGDKHGLVQAVIGFQIEATLDDQRPLLDHLDSFEALRAWCDALAAVQERRYCAGGCAVGSLASELVEGDDIHRAGLAAAFERWEKPIRDGLDRMRQRGELVPEADVHDLATALLAAVQGGSLLAQIHRTIRPFNAATEAVVAHVESFSAQPKRV